MKNLENFRKSISRKQAYLYTALCFLSLVLGILQGIGYGVTFRE
jgi:hypothetical protein